jgi:hypothetical protein
MYVYTCIRMYACIDTHGSCVCVRIHMHTYIHTYTHTYVHTCLHALVRVFDFFFCIFGTCAPHIYIYIYIYIHTYTHTHTHIHMHMCVYAHVCKFSLLIVCILLSYPKTFKSRTFESTAILKIIVPG